MHDINSVLINANLAKNGIRKILNSLIRFLNKQKIEVLLLEQYFNGKVNGHYSFYKKATKTDLAIVIGGDGTILSTVKILNSNIPILAINRGTLGFIADISPDEIFSALKKVISANFTIDKRIMLQIAFDGRKFQALNDVVITKGAYPGIADFEVWINNELLSTIRADGIIISTPTGSTAYSLSCSGPILHPGINAIIINFICPHSLSLRPLIIQPSDTVKIKIKTESNYMMLNADGQTVHKLSSNDEILISKSKKTANFVKISNLSFYKVLQRKLHLAIGGKVPPC